MFRIHYLLCSNPAGIATPAFIALCRGFYNLPMDLLASRLLLSPIQTSAWMTFLEHSSIIPFIHLQKKVRNPENHLQSLWPQPNLPTLLEFATPCLPHQTPSISENRGHFEEVLLMKPLKQPGHLSTVVLILLQMLQWYHIFHPFVFHPNISDLFK